MSKHSMRSGSTSSPSARCSSSSDSTRCWRRRSAFRRSWSSASFALRSASSRMRRLSPRSAARTSTPAPRRSDSAAPIVARSSSSISPWTMICGGIAGPVGVVLGDELDRDVREPELARVLEVERLAVGEHAVADLEDLRVGVDAVDRDGDRVDRADRVVGDALALQQRAHGAQPVALQRRLLVLLRLGGGVHARSISLLDLLVAAGQERDDAVDRLHVLLTRDVAHARRAAAVDVEVQARRARAPPRLGALAGAQQEDLAEHVERRARALGVRVRAEVGARAAVALAREVDAREVLVHRDRDVRVALVVAQADVELRLVALDQVLLGEQRLGLARQQQHVDVVRLLDHLDGAARDRVGEVARDALLQRARLADVDDLAGGVLEEVDAGPVGQARGAARAGARSRAVARLAGHASEDRSTARRLRGVRGPGVDARMPDSRRPAIRTCPLCEATCGLELTIDGGRRHARSAATRTTSSARASSAPRARACASCTRIPTACAARCAARADGAFEPVSWDEAFAEIAERFAAVDGAARAPGVRRLHRQPGGALDGRAALRPGAAEGARHAQHLQRQHRRPGAQAGGVGADVRHRPQRPGPRPRPHRPPRDPGRRPDGLQRLADDRARRARAAARDPRARRQGRRDRPAPLAHRRRGRRAPLRSARAATRCCCSRSSTCCSTRTSSTPEPRVAEHLAGLDEVRALAEPFTPDAVAPATGHRRGRRSAAWRASSRRRRRAAVYGRIGTTTQAFGALSSWLIDVVNTLTGQPRPPGRRDVHAPAFGTGNTSGEPGRGAGTQIHRWTSRVSGRGEVFGELPAACLREEIATPGEGQIRALITIAGNPVLSTPGGDRLAAELDTLDLMVSIDPYVNETTRHAHVILPPPSVLERSHYDAALYAFAIRNVANYSPPVFEREPGRARRVGDPAAPDRHRRRAGARRPTSPRSTTSSPRELCKRAARNAGSPAHGPRPGGAAGRDSRRASGPSGCSTSSCAAAPTATASAPTRTG